jgi:alpha-beta hydrolase superfamily lysophospholipase
MFFFPGDCSGKGAEVAREIGAETLFIDNDAGEKISLWHIPAIGERKGVVYFLHGNAQSNCSHVPPVLWLPENGFDLYALDYRGYGMSEGTASFDGAVDDVLAGYRYVAKITAERGESLAVLGQSIGGSLAIKALVEVEPKPKLVVLDSAFSGCQRIVRDKLWLLPLMNYPLSQLFSCGANPEDLIAQLAPARTVFLHCEADGTVSSYHSKRLFKRAADPKDLTLVEECDHINALSQPEVRRELLRDLSHALANREAKQCPSGILSSLKDPSCLINWRVYHRSRTSSEQPGNTEALVRAAFNNRAPAIEIDLRLSRDRELVVFHDKRLTTASVSGPSHLMGRQIEDLSALEVQQFRYKGTKEKIAVYRDLIKGLPDNDTILFLDVKGNFERIVRAAVRLATRFGASKKIVVQCDNVEELQFVKKEFPKIVALLRVHQLSDLDAARREKPDVVQVDEPLIGEAVGLKLGQPVRVLTKNYEQGIDTPPTEELFKRGVDLVMVEVAE